MSQTQPSPSPMSLFKAGRVVITPAVSASCNVRHLVRCMLRHLSGDWGDVSRLDRFANDAAVRDGERILSSYPLDPAAPSADKLWVLTEADRSTTTILLPSDY